MTNRAGIQARLEALAAGLTGVSAERSAGQVSWSAGGHAFAVLTDDALELRLSAPVAAAAANTPETEPSARGVGWVRFTPTALDARAIDRLEAWFAFGARHAAESAGPTFADRRRRPN
jgi:hypothetical protein